MYYGFENNLEYDQLGRPLKLVRLEKDKVIYVFQISYEENLPVRVSETYGDESRNEYVFVYEYR